MVRFPRTSNCGKSSRTLIVFAYIGGVRVQKKGTSFLVFSFRKDQTRLALVHIKASRGVAVLSFNRN